MPVARLLPATLVLCLSAAPAVAGPVWVHYQFDSTALPVSDVSAGYIKLEQHYGGRVDAGTPQTIATFRFLPSYPAEGNGLSFVSDSADTFTGATQFAMKVELTDEMSGELGEVKITGAASSTWARMPDGTVAPVDAAFLFDDFGTRKLSLGGRQFDVFLNGGTSQNGDAIVASVSIGMSFVTALQTPEPGTLALSVIGLAAAGGRAVRRKRRLTPSS